MVIELNPGGSCSSVMNRWFWKNVYYKPNWRSFQTIPKRLNFWNLNGGGFLQEFSWIYCQEHQREKWGVNCSEIRGPYWAWRWRWLWRVSTFLGSKTDACIEDFNGEGTFRRDNFLRFFCQNYLHRGRSFHLRYKGTHFRIAVRRVPTESINLTFTISDRSYDNQS